MDKTWVLAEQRDGTPAGIVLELVTAARGFGSVVEAVTWGPGGAGAAAVLGRYGVTKLYNLGDIGESLPGPKVAAAIAAQLAAESRPDAILIGATHDGRDIAARLSARLDLPVLANVVGMDASGGRLTSEHSIFGGSTVVRAEFTGAVPGLFIVQAKSFAAEAAEAAEQRSLEIVEVEVPDTGPSDAARVVTRHEEEHSGPKLDEATVVVSGGRGLGSPGNYAAHHRACAVVERRPGRIARRRRRRLGTVRVPGRPDRQDSETGGLHRLRDLRSDTARGGHEGRAVHHRGQQGPGSSHLRDRGPRCRW